MKQFIVFKISRSFLSPTLFKVETHKKNSGYRSPTLFVGWGEGLGLCELENAPEMKSALRFLTMIVAMTSQTPNGLFSTEIRRSSWRARQYFGFSFALWMERLLHLYVSGCCWLKSCRNASRVFFFSCTRVMMIITSFSWYNFVWRVFIAFSRPWEWKGLIDRPCSLSDSLRSCRDCCARESHQGGFPGAAKLRVDLLLILTRLRHRKATA